MWGGHNKEVAESERSIKKLLCVDLRVKGQVACHWCCTEHAKQAKRVTAFFSNSPWPKILPDNSF